MGNFSRSTFDPRKNYTSVRLQQGVPLVDADWNEMEDIRRNEVRQALRTFVGDAVTTADDGFRIAPLGNGGMNTLVLTAPSVAGGSSVVVDPASTAAAALGFGGGNSVARRTGTGSARLTGNASQPFGLAAGQTLVLRVNGGAPVTVTFQAAGFGNIAAATAAEVAAAVNAANPGLTASTGSGNDVAIGAGTCIVSGWTAVNDRLLPYTAQPLYQNTALATAWGVAALPALTMPVATRVDTVYLDVWEREVGEAEDPTIVNPQIGIETSVRLRREWVVRVAEGQAAPPPPITGHVHYPLARLTRPAGVAIGTAQIADLRATVRTLAGQNAEGARLESAKVDRAGDTVTGNLVVQGRVGAGSGMSSPLAPLHLAGSSADVGSATVDGDLRIGNTSNFLKVGTGLTGAEAGTTRVRASHRLTLGAGAADLLTMSGTRVEVGSTGATSNPLRVVAAGTTAVQVEAAGDTTTEKYGVNATVTGTDGGKYAILGNATGAAGWKVGIRGNASGEGNSKYGVYGTADGAQDYKYGVVGSSGGAAGVKYGVYGAADGADGSMYGLYSSASGALGYKYGAMLRAAGADGPKIGISVTAEGEASSKTGMEVRAQGLNGTKTGIQLQVSGDEEYKVGVTASVYGVAGDKYGVQAHVNGARDNKIGGNFTATGESGLKYGVYGVATGRDDQKYGVRGEASGDLGTKYALSGIASGADGIKYGLSTSASGDQGNKYGAYVSAYGVGGLKYGVFGAASGDGGTNYGVYGQASGAGAVNWAGYFSGNVHVNGTLSKTAGTFLIDHPLDPENRVLRHNFVESPEYLCLYRGRVALGKDGTATVPMPEYFKALTDEADATVQLTPIGAKPFLASYEWNKANDALVIHGDAGAEVSWLVMADRDDPAIRLLRQPVEEDKDGSQFPAGEYLNPEAYPRRKPARGRNSAAAVRADDASSPQADEERVRREAERMDRQREERAEAEEKRYRELRAQQEEEETRRTDELARERRRLDERDTGKKPRQDEEEPSGAEAAPNDGGKKKKG